MEVYPVDIDPGQVVRWLKAENAAAPGTFRITATRRREIREIPIRRETHLGDEEREDLREIATIATLEIAPIHASDGWLLSVVVEDEVGPGISDGAGEGEQRIDLGTFDREFIRPGRGSANVVAEVENSAAKARVSRLLSAIERDRQSPHLGSSRC
jgi:hypothetical protein